MTDAKSAWHEASERFGSLGSKLKTHYELQRGQEADEAKAEVKDALHRLSGALEDAFEALGKAAKDDAVKTDVKQVGQSLATALGATFTEVSGELQRAFTKRGGPSTGDEHAPAETTGETSGAVTDAGAKEGEAGAKEGEAGPKDGGAEPPRVEPWGTP
jgi:Flp pilus assembly pilin Flp